MEDLLSESNDDNERENKLIKVRKFNRRMIIRLTIKTTRKVISTDLED